MGPMVLYISIFLFLYISIYLYILLYIYISCIISIYRAVYLSNVTSLYFRTQLGQKLFTISFHIGLSIYIYTYVPSIYICKNLLNTIRYTWGTSSLTVSPEDKFVNSVTKMIERKNEDQQEVKSGWFTPAQMKTELKWDQPLYSVIGSSILAYSVWLHLWCVTVILCPSISHVIPGPTSRMPLLTANSTVWSRTPGCTMFSIALIFQNIHLMKNMCSLLTPGMTSILPKSRNTLWSTVTKRATRRPTRRLRNLRPKRRPPASCTKHYQTYLFDVFACSSTPREKKCSWPGVCRARVMKCSCPTSGCRSNLRRLQRRARLKAPMREIFVSYNQGPLVVLKLCILYGVLK